MENAKKVIIGKISARRESYPMKKDEVLIAVENGQVKDVIRDAGKVTLSRTEKTEWYFVDGREQQYDLSYNGGSIQFTFSFVTKVAFPTLLLSQIDLIGKDMTAAVLDWAASSYLSNIVAECLSSQEIATEKQLFEGHCCEHVERELMIKCREHFIKEWGMLIQSVMIKKKLPTKQTTPHKISPYDYLL